MEKKPVKQKIPLNPILAPEKSKSSVYASSFFCHRFNLSETQQLALRGNSGNKWAAELADRQFCCSWKFNSWMKQQNDDADHQPECFYRFSLINKIWNSSVLWVLFLHPMLGDVWICKRASHVNSSNSPLFHIVEVIERTWNTDTAVTKDAKTFLTRCLFGVDNFN